MTNAIIKCETDDCFIYITDHKSMIGGKKLNLKKIIAECLDDSVKHLVSTTPPTNELKRLVRKFDTVVVTEAAGSSIVIYTRDKNGI